MQAGWWTSVIINGLIWAAVGGSIGKLAIAGLAGFRASFRQCFLAVLVAYAAGVALITSLNAAGSTGGTAQASLSPLVGVLIAAITQTIAFVVLVQGPQGQRLGLGRSTVVAIMLSVVSLVFTVAIGMARAIFEAL